MEFETNYNYRGLFIVLASEKMKIVVVFVSSHKRCSLPVIRAVDCFKVIEEWRQN